MLCILGPHTLDFPEKLHVINCGHHLWLVTQRERFYTQVARVHVVLRLTVGQNLCVRCRNTLLQIHFTLIFRYKVQPVCAHI